MAALRRGGLKTGGEILGGTVREIYVVFLFLVSSLKNHPFALLISLTLRVLPLKNHFLIPHTAFNMDEAKLSLVTWKKCTGYIVK